MSSVPTSESQREVHVERDMEEDTQDEVEDVRSDLDGSSGAICLPLMDISGSDISFETLLDGIEMIQSLVNAISKNGNLALKAVGDGALQGLQLCRDLWCLKPGREALQDFAKNRVRDLFKCLDDAVREDGLQFTLHNCPAILNGVPTTQRNNDNRVVQHSSSRPAPANPPSASPAPKNPAPDNPALDNPPRPNPTPGNPPSDNPTLPNLPPPNSTLDTVMAATMQMLNYVWKNKWWIITGAAAGGVVAAAGVGVAAGPVVVGIAGGAVAGIAAKKIKDKCTQPPPHEHQD